MVPIQEDKEHANAYLLNLGGCSLAAALCHSPYAPTNWRRTKLSNFEATDGTLEDAGQFSFSPILENSCSLNLSNHRDIFRLGEGLRTEQKDWNVRRAH